MNFTVQGQRNLKSWLKGKVICEQSDLVFHLLKHSPEVNEDQITNYCNDWEHNLDDFLEWKVPRGDNRWKSLSPMEKKALGKRLGYLKFPYLVQEWWLVHPWLAGQLDTHGQRVLLTNLGCWWGREEVEIALSRSRVLHDIHRASIIKKPLADCSNRLCKLATLDKST